MMLRRRMPTATPSLAHTPSSSGPRCRMASHIWCTSARPGSMPSPNGASGLSTNPAIPHIWPPEIERLQFVVTEERVSYHPVKVDREGRRSDVPCPRAVDNRHLSARLAPIARHSYPEHGGVGLDFRRSPHSRKRALAC